MTPTLKQKIKEMQSRIILKARSHPLHSPEVVKLSQQVDKYVLIAMKEINNLS